MENELEDIIYRMQITKLESKLALREIERESLNREIATRTLTPDRHVEAIERRDELQTECAQLLTELETLRQSHQ
ncbi:MAG: hypothetical protein WB679_07400 [Terracidiphilus sp.]